MSTPIEAFPFPTTTTTAAQRARFAFAEGVRAPSTRPLPLRPSDCDAYKLALGREPSGDEWTRFSIVFARALKAMETAPEGASAWDDNTETWS